MRNIRVKVCRNVYEPGEDTEILLDAMEKEVLEPLLIDVGPGTGAEALHAERRGAEVIAIDVSWSACLNTLINAQDTPHIHVVQGDTLTPLRQGACRAAVFNTPYLPVKDGIPGSEAWSGGERGVSQALRFLREAVRTGCHVVIMVTSSLADVEAILREAERLGYKGGVAAEKHLFFETIMALRLEKQGAKSLIKPRGNQSPALGQGERVIDTDQSSARGA